MIARRSTSRDALVRWPVNSAREGKGWGSGQTRGYQPRALAGVRLARMSQAANEPAFSSQTRQGRRRRAFLKLL
jgi:hypothetical protein